MTLRPLVLALAAAFALPLTAQAAKYTYHGDLMDGDAPAEGAYDLRVRAFAQPGATKALAEASELPGVKLDAGRFSVELELPEDVDGTTWIEVAVRKAGSGDPFETLGEPQPISKANSTCPGAWALDGNSGMPAGSFLGSVDANAGLQLRAGGRRVAQYDSPDTPGYIDAPKVVLGSTANQATGVGATVCGGGATHDGDTSSPTPDPMNRNLASGRFATVAGGYGNTASEQGSFASGSYTTASGEGSFASGVRTQASGIQSVANGYLNEASGVVSTVSGGGSNQASGQASVVVGGTNNRAAGEHSAASGGTGNCAGGDHSWVGGFGAIVRSGNQPDDGFCGSGSGDTDGDQGSFVWADYRLDNVTNRVTFTSTGPNQFLARAAGGVAFNGTPANPGFELSVFGNDPDSGFVEVLLTPKPSLNGNTGESIEFGAGRGGAGNNDATFRITQRNALGGFFQALTIGSDGVTNVKNGAVGNVSDARLKKNIQHIPRPLDTLLSLNGHVFEYIDPAKSMNTPGPRMGFIAQEVRQTLPNWVTQHDSGYLQVSTIGFEALAVEAIRDLKTEGDLRVEALEAEVAALLLRLERLESRRGR